MLLAGCSGTSPDGYDPNLRYPLRTDPLVIASPPEAPPRPEAGRLTEWFAGLSARGGKTLDPNALDPTAKAKLTAVLEDLFGTPAAPRLPEPASANLGLTEPVLAEGSRLYRRHCAHCHGLTGEGRGPTGDWIVPRPRDLRLGAFKFGSAPAGIPTRADLTKVIRRGVPGTAMQPFGLLSDGELETLAAAATHLGIRGEVEFRLIRTLLEDPPDDLTAEAKAETAKVLARWSVAPIAVPAGPTPTRDEDEFSPAHLDSVRRGFGLFVGAKAGCANCHQDFGRAEKWLYDVWGTAVRVTDLTTGEFRGGSSPEELFRRVRLGIPPAGMPASPALTDAEVWDLVHFVRAVSKPARLPADVTAKIFPGRN